MEIPAKPVLEYNGDQETFNTADRNYHNSESELKKLNSKRPLLVVKNPPRSMQAKKSDLAKYFKRGEAVKNGQNNSPKRPENSIFPVKGGQKPTTPRSTVKKVASKVSPKSKEQTPELKRILNRIKEKKMLKNDLKSRNNKNNENVELMPRKNENKTNSVSTLRKVFESDHKVDKNVIKSTQIPTMHKLKRLNSDSPLPKLGSPRRGTTKKGTPRRGKKFDCILDKNQLRLIDFWEKKSTKVPNDDSNL